MCNAELNTRINYVIHIQDESTKFLPRDVFPVMALKSIVHIALSFNVPLPELFS